MKLPNGSRSVVELDKLTAYCLNRAHPRGRHKARVFASRLGISADNAEVLREALLRAAMAEEAVELSEDDYGRRFLIEFGMETEKGAARIRAAWIVPKDDLQPRLTTCYII